MVFDYKKIFIEKQNEYIKNPSDKLIKQIMKLKEWLNNENNKGQ